MSDWNKTSNTAERLKEAMRLKNMKQADLARATGLGKGGISNYVMGRYEPKSDVISKLAQALNCSEMWLWGYDVPKTRTPEQKKNDSLAETIVKMRKHPDLTEAIYKVVSLYEQSPEDFASLDRILSGLVNK